MIDVEQLEIVSSELPCDECGQEPDDCECIACQDCMEFGPGAATVDQNLALCENCAEERGVELMDYPALVRKTQEEFNEAFKQHKEEKDD